MKPVIMILLASLYGILAFGQVKVKTTNTVYFLTELKRHNPALLSVGSGEILEIDLKSGKFWEATYKEQLGYLGKRDLKYCVPLDSTITIRNNAFHVKKSRDSTAVVNLKYDAVSVGKDLYNGSGVLVSGIIIAGFGTLMLPAIGYNVTNTRFEDWYFFFPTVLISGLILEITGGLKIMRAGKRLYFGQTSSGIGMSINLNK